MIDIDPKLILIGAILSSLAMLCTMLWLIKEESETKTLYFHVLDVCPCAEPDASLADFCKFGSTVNLTEWYSHTRGNKAREPINVSNNTGGVIGWQPMNRT